MKAVVVCAEGSGDPDDLLTCLWSAAAGGAGIMVVLVQPSVGPVLVSPECPNERYYLRRYVKGCDDESIRSLVVGRRDESLTILDDEGFNLWVKRYGFPVFREHLKEYLFSQEPGPARDPGVSRRVAHHQAGSIADLLAPVCRAFGVQLVVSVGDTPSGTPVSTAYGAGAHPDLFWERVMGKPIPKRRKLDDASGSGQYEDASGSGQYEGASGSGQDASNSGKGFPVRVSHQTVVSPDAYDHMLDTYGPEKRLSQLVRDHPLVVPLSEAHRALGQCDSWRLVVAGTPAPVLDLFETGSVSSPIVSPCTRAAMMVSAHRTDPDPSLSDTRPMNMGSEQTNFKIGRESWESFFSLVRRDQSTGSGIFSSTRLLIIPTEPCKYLARVYRRSGSSRSPPCIFGSEIAEKLYALWGHASSPNSPETRKGTYVVFDLLMCAADDAWAHVGCGAVPWAERRDIVITRPEGGAPRLALRRPENNNNAGGASKSEDENKLSLRATCVLDPGNEPMGRFEDLRRAFGRTMMFSSLLLTGGIPNATWSPVNLVAWDWDLVLGIGSTDPGQISCPEELETYWKSNLLKWKTRTHMTLDHVIEETKAMFRQMPPGARHIVVTNNDTQTPTWGLELLGLGGIPVFSMHDLAKQDPSINKGVFLRAYTTDDAGQPSPFVFVDDSKKQRDIVVTACPHARVVAVPRPGKDKPASPAGIVYFPKTVHAVTKAAWGVDEL